MRLRLAILAGALAAPVPALAHVAAIAHEEPGWTFDPWLVVPLVLCLLLYLGGAFRLVRRSGLARGVRRRRRLLFGLGWAALAGAVVSPLHAAGEQSFTLHMVEHEILMLLAAPLLVLSRPLPVMIWALPRPARRTLGSLGRRRWLRTPWTALSDPIAATMLQAAMLWLWHMPALFDLALRRDGWHIAQHLSFLVSALFFWQAMLKPRRGAGLGLSAICLFATSLLTGALGALMAFSQSPWYAPYAMLGLTPFGLTPAEDQQLAGLLMWIPGGLVHAGAALALVGQALNERSGWARTS